MAWWLPLSVMAVTDLLLNWHYGAALLAPEMLGTYGAYLALILLGRRFTPRAPFLGLLGGGVLGAGCPSGPGGCRPAACRRRCARS